MDNNLWDDDNSEFLDRPEETKVDTNGQQLQAPPVTVQTYRPSNVPAEPVATLSASSQVESTYYGELPEIDLEDDFSEVLNDANLRIEQGRLYQMIMNHDLFEGMDSDPKAIQNVQKEIRKFARERMEIMLGMRQEQMAKDYADYAAQMMPSPFNDLEVDILKKIASKATNGATESPEANKVASTLRETPRRQTLNTISKTVKQAPKKDSRPLTKSTAPLQRKRLDPMVEQILAEEGVPRELIEEDYKPIGKPLHMLSAQELEERQKQTALRLARRKPAKATGALPMASPEQQEMMAMQRASQIGASPGMAALLEKVKSMPVKTT